MDAEQANKEKTRGYQPHKQASLAFHTKNTAHFPHESTSSIILQKPFHEARFTLAKWGFYTASLGITMAIKSKHQNVISACPENWSDKSKQSVAYLCGFKKEYGDIQYTCWRCRRSSVFTAEEQKYVYEVKKAYIVQKRIVCSECWHQSKAISDAIKNCKDLWATSKEKLKSDSQFLSEWLELLVRRDEYLPYKPNTAIKNMLGKLLKQNA